jgi:hypothetical protein
MNWTPLRFCIVQSNHSRLNMISMITVSNDHYQKENSSLNKSLQYEPSNQMKKKKFRDHVAGNMRYDMINLVAFSPSKLLGSACLVHLQQFGRLVVLDHVRALRQDGVLSREQCCRSHIFFILIRNFQILIKIRIPQVYQYPLRILYFAQRYRYR